MSSNATETAFGYYPRPLSIIAGHIEIETRPDLENQVTAVAASGQIDGDWLYAPAYENRPYISRVFGLPKTHILRHTMTENDDHIEFLIWALSFFVGLRLTLTKAGYLDATPVKPGYLVDFHASRSVLSKLLTVADDFWVVNRNDPMRAKRFAAAVHALFLGQYSRNLQFERFIYLYTALDACFALASSLHSPPKGLRHSERIGWMCSLFGMTTPAWAGLTGTGKAEVSTIRNDTLHEALYMGEPLGFGLHGIGTNQNLTLQMKALVCRLLIALVGASSAGYVRTAIDTRQYYGLDP